MIITKVETRYIKIPESYFYMKEIDINRSIISTTDVSKFMLDLYSGYDECRINLNTIKRLNNEGDE